MLLVMRQDSKRKRVRAIRRPESRVRYENLEVKGEEYSNRALSRVEEMQSYFYAGLDPRRRQEMADGGMLKEDSQAMANLSNKPVHRQYPAYPFYSSPYIDDATEEK
jgi:hypothetical protein